MIRQGREQESSVEPEFQIADIVIGVLAGLGVIVLIIVFVLVFRSTFLKKD